jgi:hypothetical protein
MSDWQAEAVKANRVLRLVTALGASVPRATEMAEKLSGLTDEQFEDYARTASASLAELKARVGQGLLTPPEDEVERVRARVADHVAGMFGLDDANE